MTTELRERAQPPARAAARPPRLRPAIVSRPRLVRLLDSLREPAVVVTAPPGYGKTTLLAEWAAADARSVRWILMRDGCDSPAEMALRVASALARVAPLDDRLPEMIAAESPQISGEARDRLLAGVEDAVPFLLVIDDLHAIADARTLELVAALAAAVPAGSTLAVAGRRAVGGPLNPLRASGVVADVGAGMLAMTRVEIGSALHAMGLRPSDDAMDAVADRTEGWPAVVRLVGRAMRQNYVPLARDGPPEGGEPLAQYLTQEVLGDQPEGIRELLLRTCVLRRISGPLAAFLTGDPEAADELPRLADAGLPVARVAAEGEWFRVHPVLRRHLRAQLRRRDHALERALHLLASRWHAGEGRAGDAFHHAVAAEDRRTAGRIFTGALLGCHAAGLRTEPLAWRASLTVEDARADPTLAAAMAWHDALEGVEGAKRLAAIAASADTCEAASPMGFASLEAASLAWRAAFGSGGVDEMTASADAVYEAERPESPVRALACVLAGAARIVDGRLDEAGRLLRDAQVLLPAGHAVHEQLALGLLAYLELRLDRAESATADASLAGSLIAGHRLRRVPWAAPATAALAAALAEAGDASAAAVQLRFADALLDRAMASPWLGTMAGLLSARAHRALGDRDAAGERLAGCRARLAAWPGDSSLAAHLAEEERALEAGPPSPDRVVDGPPQLSHSEIKVLGMLPSPLALREIAAASYLSRNTVKTHVASIYRKLSVSTRTEAVERARILGLLEG